MRNVFQDGQSKAVLLVDATNAFNSLNRQAHHSCSSITLLWDVEERSNEEEEAKKGQKKTYTAKSKTKRSISMVERSDEISKESKKRPQCPKKFKRIEKEKAIIQKKNFKGNCSRQNTYPYKCRTISTSFQLLIYFASHFLVQKLQHQSYYVAIVFLSLTFDCSHKSWLIWFCIHTLSFCYLNAAMTMLIDLCRRRKECGGLYYSHCILMIAVVLFSCCHCYVKPHNYVGSVLVCCSNFGLIILSTEIFLKGKNDWFH